MLAFQVAKMPDGGFRPAYNVQWDADSAGGVNVGVDIANVGNAGQPAPLERQVVQRSGEHLKDCLMDGSFATRMTSPPWSD